MKTVWFTGYLLLASFLSSCGIGGNGDKRSVSSQPLRPWDAYNLAPTSRTVKPVSIHTTTGTVNNPDGVIQESKATVLSGRNSSIVIDFGREVGGHVTIDFSGASSNHESLGLAFSESSYYVGSNSDSSNGGKNNTDGALYISINSTGASSYTTPASKLRGGFRYLTLFLTSEGSVSLARISLDFSPVPLMTNPSAYPNYFYSNDELINKIWYAGAYTVQTNIIKPTEGRVWGPPNYGWDNSAAISRGNSVLTDGAKRDRAVWGGDLGIAALTAYAAINDTVSIRNALESLYDNQRDSGELPMVGPPISFFDSDTYHLWTLIITYNYYLYTGDVAWLEANWTRYKSAMAFIRNKVNGPNGLLNVTGKNDWTRGGQGGENLAANSLLYRALVTGASMSARIGDSNLQAAYLLEATTLKERINSVLWNEMTGAYKDNPSSVMYPQDGNSLAVWFEIANSKEKISRVCEYLKGNWNNLGATTPEWYGKISTFAGSMEIQAHFIAFDDEAALELIRREWGYMYNHPKGAKTFWEGFNADGSFEFGGSYMSLAHGWATGPTSALTHFVLGILPTEPSGKKYSVIPHPGNLKQVEGKLTLENEAFIAVSYVRSNAESFSMKVTCTGNTGSTAVIGIPKFSAARVVLIDSIKAWDGNAFLGSEGISSAEQDARYIYFKGVQCGERTFSWEGSV